MRSGVGQLVRHSRMKSRFRPDYWPIPVSATVAIALGLLAVMVRVAATALLALGVNWTKRRQLELAASVAPQVLICVKDAAPVPLSAIDVRFIGVLPLVLVRVRERTAWALPAVIEPKLSVLDESANDGAMPPDPLRATDWVVGDALSVKTRVAAMLPVVMGLKRTSAVQLADTASELGQLFIWLKEVGLAPANVNEEKISGPLPALVRVMIWAGLKLGLIVVPAAVSGKLSEETESLTAGVRTMPVPLSATVCGELAALSATLRVAVSGPAAVGLKVTVTVQEALAPSAAPQVLVWENDEAFAPLKETLEMVVGPVPVFRSVVVCTAEGEPTLVVVKTRVAGERLTAGAVPVPLSVMVCGELAALSATLSVAVSTPETAGLKVMVTVQEALAASDAPQLLVWEKEDAFAPATEMLEMVSAPVPVFLSVMDWAVEVRPTFKEE